MKEGCASGEYLNFNVGRIKRFFPEASDFDVQLELLEKLSLEDGELRRFHWYIKRGYMDILKFVLLSAD